ncbi:pentatricopeptide repeat-containing protein At3g02490, mitochondrial-like [Phoenix dactylifera]|uniref:Pentatricopeptide repeat-containing protein At3g02490, mitochondrial-like n=1 Tax=Phoenix dactylifera TaxID=42345 RepID=A0A8B9AHN5_PHODC|nr:pentatricopeptide repeat-containing protein At3g02490, mitochondrial-like [Phoenix dactylifera]
MALKPFPNPKPNSSQILWNPNLKSQRLQRIERLKHSKMRNGWKALCLRSFSRISAQSSRIGFLNLQVRAPEPQNATFLAPFLGRHTLGNPRDRYFSSKPAIDRKDHNHALVTEIFSKPIGSDEIKAELESLNLSLDQETVNLVLWDLEGSPEIARRFFDWVSERGTVRLNSRSYNLMLEIVGTKGRSEEFWAFVEIMKKKGFGLSKDAYLKVSESFKEKEMEKDFNLLKEICFLNSHENVVGRMCSQICKILRQEDESSEIIQKKLEDLGVSLSSDLVVAVLERISSYPKKALRFFRWVEEDGSFKIDGRVYNAMARVLGREDCVEEFCDVLHKIRNGRYQLEPETYIKVLERFLERKMSAEAVNLYAFVLDSSEKPSPRDFILLLRKIVVSKDPELNLITRVVRTFINAGNSMEGSVLGTVLKSLSSVGKLGECDKILKAMEEGGFVADSSVHDRVVVGLVNSGRFDDALEYLDNGEKSGYSLDPKTWASLVQKHSLAGELDKALQCFYKMIERKDGENVGCAIEVLVNGFYQKDRAKDAYKILKDLVTKKNVEPWHTTYNFLIESLISQGYIKEACSLLGLMKTHGYPPFIDPFIGYISKSGTVDDALSFLKAMTVKEFPSKTVYLHMFEELLKAGRHQVAHGILSKSPGCVRNHADVLDLFYLMKPDEATAAAS